MNKEKRSFIDDSRLSELHKPGGVYTITCGIDGCPCNRKDDGCGRGFFSLFIQAVYGIEFSDRVKIPYHVNYGNVRYRYSDTNGVDKNFWNYYFNQPLKKIDKTCHPVVNRFIELYPLKIWDRQHFREINKKVIRHLSFTKELKNRLEEPLDQMKGKNVLGVHIRLTDHGEEISPVRFEKYLRTINKYIHFYDSLFVATDDSKTLHKLQNQYGDKVIFNSVVRSTDDRAIHLNDSIENRIGLGLDVFVDCYCLSLCNKVILNHSNVSYAALLFNPELSYILLERTRPKIKRLKTLFLYNLNRWGIRKW